MMGEHSTTGGGAVLLKCVECVPIDSGVLVVRMWRAANCRRVRAVEKGSSLRSAGADERPEGQEQQEAH